MIYTGWAQSLSPGNEQFDFFGSEAADRDASRNYAGIKDPAVDALDQARRLRQGPRRAGRGDRGARPCADGEPVRHPDLHIAQCARFAYWDKFGHPEELSGIFGIGFPDVWWYDAKKAAALK